MCHLCVPEVEVFVGSTCGSGTLGPIIWLYGGSSSERQQAGLHSPAPLEWAEGQKSGRMLGISAILSVLP